MPHRQGDRADQRLTVAALEAMEAMTQKPADPSYLTEELVALGHEVTLARYGITSSAVAKSVPGW
jgi:hypothetical protein